MKTDVHDAAGASTAATKKNRTREVRFALVLNGGVSLAVWMGGVTHELNRLRLASEEEGSDSVWRKILDAAGRTATIDLVAGTSAGGLNGAVLATTIARGGDMPNMRDRWSDLASLDVGKLTNSNPDGARSVLDGAYLQEGRRRRVGRYRATGRSRQGMHAVHDGNRVGHIEPRWNWPDGRTVITADGRRVYKFVHRNATNDVEEINHFAPGDGDDDALTTAARATAAFPVAFEPVLQTGQLRDWRDPPAPNAAARHPRRRWRSGQRTLRATTAGTAGAPHRRAVRARSALCDAGRVDRSRRTKDRNPSGASSWSWGACSLRPESPTSGSTWTR